MKSSRYDFSKSIKDENQKLIRVPVKLFGQRKNWIDINLALEISAGLEVHYKDVLFTSRYDVFSEKNKIKEYLFYFK